MSMLRSCLILKCMGFNWNIVDDDQIRSVPDAFFFGLVQLRFFDSSGKVHANMKAWRKTLIIMDDLKAVRWMKSPWVALRSMVGVTDEICIYFWRRVYGCDVEERAKKNEYRGNDFGGSR